MQVKADIVCEKSGKFIFESRRDRYAKVKIIYCVVLPRTHGMRYIRVVSGAISLFNFA